MSLPNLLTIFRVILIPVVVVVYYVGDVWGHLWATFLFSIASVTDLVDGYLARNLQQETRFGAFLDPIADKLLVTTALGMVIGEVGNIVITIPAIIIILRELTISGLREWVAKIGSEVSMKVSFIAKAKTMIQMFAVGALLLYNKNWPLEFNVLFVGYGVCLLYIAALMTVFSMLHYLYLAWPSLFSK